MGVPGTNILYHPWNVDSCSNATAEGHLEVLKWAREKGCEWDESCSEKAHRMDNMKF